MVFYLHLILSNMLFYLCDVFIKLMLFLLVFFLYLTIDMASCYQRRSVDEMPLIASVGIYQPYKFIFNLARKKNRCDSTAAF